MAEIRPFSALRYTEKAGDVKTCVCPPYDIISPKQKEEYLKTNPHNIIKLELPGTDYADYERAATTLDSWKEDGILKQDECDSIYAYEEELYNRHLHHENFENFTSFRKTLFFRTKKP